MFPFPHGSHIGDHMKIHVAISLPEVSKALTLVVKAFGHAATTTDEADIVLSDDPDACRQALRAGKQAIQFIAWKHPPPTVLAPPDDVAPRFRVYQVVEWIKGIPVAEEMYEYLKSLPTE
ncbi:hypothetical protein A3E39_04180 [Candidatus Uhrbacteria bacterium RIFCSPHIGHO2_12_FULL_60_25]|uniref:Uncharacterized protein n=1 Tax=Candidatus Uhrbacteria bacterium RIFCSPHIGHO2_12_FULL_60_25 TaxID=1802399 RepID=A0A1F7ULH4_9BACT|nr:MAG: hypothetical protein A3D73_01205 [Candidatus Uhrbacteria bacterium RIFCSPHIGHO2_02_FULL_60_44]OGL79132.1 MAG: hypothetical protein A3E39_04180 [Candidatus Uhrbacteria bacterium RIFCSPHIGHO2_12_FULL_60_25]